MDKYLSLKYKAKKPEETVNFLKDILYKLDLPAYEQKWFTNPNARSVRLVLPNLSFGVNGKGISKKYALASAYGELFERMQNISIFNKVFQTGISKSLALKYSDQKPYSYSTRDLNVSFFNYLFKDLKAKKAFINDNKHIVIPFFNINRKKTMYLPERALRYALGTNGMCGGNSISEALIQGICEILERHVLKQILCFGAQPLEIPLIYVKPLIVKRYINPLKNLGYKVYLKDCTLGGKFPVVGVFIKQKNKGLFHMGASPDLNIALERCFTEMLQGESINNLKNILQPIRKDNNNIKNINYWQKQFAQAFRNYKSELKTTMYKNKKFMSKSHVFVSKDLTSKKTLSNLIKTLINQGYEIFIRNNSFLGFFAFQIYIPRLSELLLLDKNTLALHNKVVQARKIFFNLSNSSNQDFTYLANVIEELITLSPAIDKSLIMVVIHNLKVSEDAVLNQIDYRLFLSIIYFHIGNIIKAKEKLHEYIDHFDNDNQNNILPKYLFCLQKIFDLRRKKISWAEINKSIVLEYNDQELATAYFPILKKENISNFFGIPNCGNCVICKYNDCKFEVLKKYSGLLQAKINKKMQQDSLIKFLKCIDTKTL